MKSVLTGKAKIASGFPPGEGYPYVAADTPSSFTATKDTSTTDLVIGSDTYRVAAVVRILDDVPETRVHFTSTRAGDDFAALVGKRVLVEGVTNLCAGQIRKESTGGEPSIIEFRNRGTYAEGVVRWVGKGAYDFDVRNEMKVTLYDTTTDDEIVHAVYRSLTGGTRSRTNAGIRDAVGDDLFLPNPDRQRTDDVVRRLLDGDLLEPEGGDRISNRWAVLQSFAGIPYPATVAWISAQTGLGEVDVGTALAWLADDERGFVRRDGDLYYLTEPGLGNRVGIPGWIAVGADSSQSSFAASDFTDGGRSVTLLSGIAATVPAYTGNRYFAIAVPSADELRSVTAQGFLGDFLDDMTKADGMLTIGSTTVNVWTSDQAVNLSHDVVTLTIVPVAKELIWPLPGGRGREGG